MEETRLVWTGERLQFTGHTGYGDPVSLGGDPEGPGAKPSDLLPISLAACTAYDVVVILRKQRQDLQGLEVVVTSDQDVDPPWIFHAIHSRFVVIGDVDLRKAQKAVALAESRYCSVAATLRPVVALTHSVEVRSA
jgi:putative redox protein